MNPVLAAALVAASVIVPLDEDPNAVLAEVSRELGPRASENWPDSVPVRHFWTSTIARTSPFPGVCERDALNIQVLKGQPLPASSPRVRSIWAERTFLLISVAPRTELRLGDAYASWDSRCAQFGQAGMPMGRPPLDRTFEDWPDAESVWIAGQLVAELAKEANEPHGKLLSDCARGPNCPSREEMSALFTPEAVLRGEQLQACEHPNFCLRIFLRKGKLWTAEVRGKLDSRGQPRFSSLRLRRVVPHPMDEL